MKTRYLYLLLFLLPSAVIAYLFALFTAGGTAGALWLFVYGDNPWPSSAGYLITIVACLSFLAAITALLISAYRTGKHQEMHGVVNRKHTLIAAGGTALLLLILAING